MPTNTYIVDQINEYLKEGILSEMAPAQFYGLGSMNQTKQKGINKAGIVTTSGEIQKVNPDDTNVLQVYHRNLSNGYGVAEDQVGDNVGRAKVADMQIFVYAKGEHLDMTADELLTYFEAAFPESLESDVLMSCDITLTSSNMEKLTLVKQEFGQDNFLKPEHYFFALRYRVAYTYTPECLREYLQSKKVDTCLT